MLIKRPKGFDPKKAVYPCLSSPKLDGVRGLQNGTQLFSRAGNVIKGIGHIERELAQFPDYFLDGELVIPGKKFDETSGLIRNFHDIPEAVYKVWDVRLPKVDISIRKSMVQVLKKCKHIVPIELHHVSNYRELSSLYESFLKAGYEGLIYYKLGTDYNSSKNHQWMKLIPEKKADCKVIGFKKGTNKNLRSLGAIVVTYKGQKCKVGTGFKELADSDIQDHVRQYIWDNQKKFLGAIAEVHFKEETKTGKMRMPRFYAWRFDKTEENYGG
jgi:ATP-dependent DNA ligase